jgi:Protein of unknown function (DUF3048) N-terminal domain/Protein of unknown function (DUF3048) C-terminal domain
MRTKLAWLVALALTLAACSSSAGGLETTTSSETTTTTQPTTTALPSTSSSSTELDFPTSPINGLPVIDSALVDRRLLAVKMDNHPAARPQSGVEKADGVVELMVEGITRFMTLWMQSDVDYFGPVRSGRPTDPTLLTALNEPTFVISGAQSWVQQRIRSMDVHLIGEVRPATFRISSRSAPHNLYADTSLLREQADSLGYPDEAPTGPIWEFGDLPAQAVAASHVRINFLGNIVEWDYDTVTGTWLRSADGRESEWKSEDGETGRIGFPVLVALYVEQYTLGPPSGVSGKALPSSHTTGTGKAFVFADGKVMEGSWERETEKDWFTLTDSSGTVIPVPPGQVWISLVPDRTGLTFE